MKFLTYTYWQKKIHRYFHLKRLKKENTIDKKAVIMRPENLELGGKVYIG